MSNISKKVVDRLAAGLKRYQPVLEAAKNRDVNESDTSMIVSDMLAEIFGFDKYTEVTREHCIRGTYCDLAVVVDDKMRYLIEVKAIGTELKDQHVKQAVDYAANKGIEWVALTNAVRWNVFGSRSASRSTKSWSSISTSSASVTKTKSTFASSLC